VSVASAIDAEPRVYSWDNTTIGLPKGKIRHNKKAEAIPFLGFLAWLTGHAEFWQVMKLTLGDCQ
jgi:hypothetical protein